MEMWGSVPVENFIAQVLHFPIGLGNDVFSNLLGFIESNVDKLYAVD